MNDLQLEGEAFNFSNEIQKNVLDLVQDIIKLMGSDKTPKILKTVKNEIPHQYLSAQKAKKLLKWKPKYTLEEGLIKTIEWYTDFLKNSQG
jgi:CDP-glucose 4,6-dehydratase